MRGIEVGSGRIMPAASEALAIARLCEAIFDTVDSRVIQHSMNKSYQPIKVMFPGKESDIQMKSCGNQQFSNSNTFSLRSGKAIFFSSVFY